MAVSFSYSVANILLMVLAISVHMNSASATRALSETTNTEFIRTSCTKTTYPRLCYSSLAVHATAIQTSPKLLASTALGVTLTSAEETSAMMSQLSQSHGMSPREAAAMRDCVEELRDSVDQIQRSIAEMGSAKQAEFGRMINDVQTWVSAALTDEATCNDGFAGNSMNGNVKIAVRNRIVNIAHLTSNALALINNYASFHG